MLPLKHQITKTLIDMTNATKRPFQTILDFVDDAYDLELSLIVYFEYADSWYITRIVIADSCYNEICDLDPDSSTYKQVAEKCIDNFDEIYISEHISSDEDLQF